MNLEHVRMYLMFLHQNVRFALFAKFDFKTTIELT